MRTFPSLILVPAALVSPALAWAQDPAAPPPSTTPPASSTPAAPPAPPAPGDGETLDLTAPPAPPPADPSENPYIPVDAVRRSGVTLGVGGGLALTSASGTRIKFSLRDQVADPGLAPGNGMHFWIGGAFTDWFSFRVGVGTSSATRKGLLISGTSVSFGVDTWPLFYRGGIFRDLGLGLDFGTGSASITSKDDDVDVRASGGGFSMVRFSAFYEPRLFWRIHGGPAISYEYRTTETYTEHLTLLGARFAFYGGP